MRQRNKLTELGVKNAKVASKAEKPNGYKLDDGGGLYLHILPSGTKAWRYDYSIAGKRKTLALGVYPVISLSEARKKFGAAKQLVTEGVDPALEKQVKKQELARQEQEKALTFEVVAWDWYKSQKQGGAEITKKTIQGRLKLHILPAIGSKPINAVTFDDLRSIIRKLESESKFDMAKRICHILSQICRYAHLNQWTPINIAHDLSYILTKRPAEDKKGFPAITSREGVADMLRKIAKYTESVKSSPYMNAALKLYPYTALRSQELFLAKWADIDMDALIWNIPAENTKTRTAFFIPISKQIKAILEELKCFRVPTGYIFNSGRGHLTGEGINKTLHMTGVPRGSHCIHGFRKTFSTLAHEAGCPASLVERSLAHKGGGEVALAYNKAEYLEPRRIVMQWWCDYLDALRDGTDLPKLALDRAAMFA